MYTTEFTERSDVHLHSTSGLSLRKVQQYTQHLNSDPVETRTHKKEEERGEGRRVLNFFETGRISKHFRVCFVVALAPELWKQSSFNVHTYLLQPQGSSSNVHTYLLQPQGSHITGSSTDGTQGDSTATIY